MGCTVWGMDPTTLALGPTLPSVQWVLGFFKGSKGAGAWR